MRSGGGGHGVGCRGGKYKVGAWGVGNVKWRCGGIWCRNLGMGLDAGEGKYKVGGWG